MIKKGLIWGCWIVIAGLFITGIGFLGHHHPFHPTTPVEESTANQHVLSRKQFNRLKVTAASAKVVIKQGTHFTVSYYGPRHPAVTAKVRHGQMVVNQTSVTKSKQSFFWTISNHQDRIIITVPQSTHLKALRIRANQDLTISQLTADHLDVVAGDTNVNSSQFDAGQIQTDSGDLNLLDTVLLSIKLQSTSGDITMKQISLTKGAAHLTSGDFTGKRLTLNGRYQVQNTSGDNTITKTKYNGARLTTKSGDNRLGYRHQEGGKLVKTSDAPNQIVLQNVSGDNTLK